MRGRRRGRSWWHDQTDDPVGIPMVMRIKPSAHDIAAHHVTYTACDSREEEALHEDQGIFTRTYDLRERAQSSSLFVSLLYGSWKYYLLVGCEKNIVRWLLVSLNSSNEQSFRWQVCSMWKHYWNKSLMGVFTSHANSKYFLFHPSHRIFERTTSVLFCLSLGSCACEGSTVPERQTLRDVVVCMKH
jgi:hypothetical protein